VQLAYLLLLAVLTAGKSVEAGDRESPERLGLPAIVPCDGARVRLGEKLFSDPGFSADGRVSCASCHNPQRAFTDGRQVAQGIGGKQVSRNAISLTNSALHTTFLWEGRRSSLEETTAGGFFNSRELGLKDQETLLTRIGARVIYRSEFTRLFRGKGLEPVSLPHVKAVLGCFVRSLAARNSPFDRFTYKGERAALTEAQQQGLRLFQGRLGCAACHTIGPRHASFTDNLLHPGHIASPVMHRLPVLLGTIVATPRTQLGELILSQPEIAALGRFVVTQEAGDIGRFRTPSLRNVAITAPYFHDGSAATLAEVVEREVYSRGSGAERPTILTPFERDYVVAFLESLTSARYAAPIEKPLVTAARATTTAR